MSFNTRAAQRGRGPERPLRRRLGGVVVGMDPVPMSSMPVGRSTDRPAAGSTRHCKDNAYSHVHFKHSKHSRGSAFGAPTHPSPGESSRLRLESRGPYEYIYIYIRIYILIIFGGHGHPFSGHRVRSAAEQPTVHNCNSIINIKLYISDHRPVRRPLTHRVEVGGGAIVLT